MFVASTKTKFKYQRANVKSMGTAIKFYYDLMSQPSRALYILFKLNKVPIQDNPVALRKGAHLTPEFKEINRFQKVPCIIDNGFKLSESVAILRYLHGKGLISDQWYPTDIELRARIDEYLEWQHNNTRMACAMYFQLTWLRPLMTGNKPDPKMLAEIKQQMEQTLDSIENVWLEKNKFLTGERINVADIFAICEIEQLRLTAYDAFVGRPNLKRWIEAVKDAINPAYNESHKILEKMIIATSKL